MDNRIKKIIRKNKRKELKKLNDRFEKGLIRNAAFSVGSDFFSARVALNDPDYLPFAVPLISKLTDSGIQIDNYQPFVLARALAKLRIPALFVATDQALLGGNLSHLKLVKTGAEFSVIQRDFIIEEIQIYQSKALGADGLLLDSELLSPAELNDFAEKTFEMGLEPFIKVQSWEDVKGLEYEIVGGLIFEKADFERIRSDSKLSKIKSIKDNPPVLMIHKPESEEELKDFYEKGITHFLLPDSWILENNPVQNLADLIKRIWPGEGTYHK